MDTNHVKILLFEAMQHPTKKIMAQLAKVVIELCDECDNKSHVMAVINENQRCMKDTFDLINQMRNPQ